jgi:hypothetical protein
MDIPESRAEMDMALVVAEAVRAACLAAAIAAYEQAGSDGLCHEGAWENALGAIRSLPVAAIVQGGAAQEGAGVRGRSEIMLARGQDEAW